MRSHLLPAFALALLGTACGGGSSASGPSYQPWPAPSSGVYVGGVVSGHGVVWRNGAAQTLPDPGGFSDVLGLAVSPATIYAAGTNDTPDGGSGVETWFQGLPERITPGATNGGIGAGGLALVGSDVYMAGYETKASTGNSFAEYWKNGAATPLTDGSTEAAACGVAVSGGDVYLAGYEKNASGLYVAMLWKNGVATPLSDGSHSAYAFGIAVSGADVYVVGSARNAANHGVAMLWKNGVATPLSDGNGEARANAIAISGSDVYIVGSSTSPAMGAWIWKNGSGSLLPSETIAANANGVAVSGADVYVAGFMSPVGGVEQACLWKNGSYTYLSDPKASTNADAYAVCVLP